MASSIVSRDGIKYTDYLGSSQQGENCFLNQPVLYKPCSIFRKMRRKKREESRKLGPGPNASDSDNSDEEL